MLIDKHIDIFYEAYLNGKIREIRVVFDLIYIMIFN